MWGGFEIAAVEDQEGCRLISSKGCKSWLVGSPDLHCCAYPCGFLKQGAFTYVEKIKLELFWVRTTEEQTEEALVIFDGQIEKIWKFVGTERGTVREDRSCAEAEELVWWVHPGQ